MNENKPRRRAQAQAAQKATRKSGLSRFVLMVTMMALVAVVSIGGTMAWLQDNTEEVVNTFTTSNIDIELNEGNELDLQMVPGKVLTKDPVVTVKENSEASWVFVEVTKSDNFDTFMDYDMDDAWKVVDETSYPNVFYQLIGKTTADVELKVIKDDHVTVLTTVKKSDMDGIKVVEDDPETEDDESSDNRPTLTFKAYAIQQANLPTPEEGKTAAVAAWELAKQTD